MVNVQTGAVALKAEFPNTNEALWPREFVAIRLVESVEPHAVTVPAIAVQMGQQEAFVYVIDHGRARSQPVTDDRQVVQLYVITSGLRGGEQVTTEFPANMQEGGQVTPGRRRRGGQAPCRRPASWRPGPQGPNCMSICHLPAGMARGRLAAKRMAGPTGRRFYRGCLIARKSLIAASACPGNGRRQLEADCL